MDHICIYGEGRNDKVCYCTGVEFDCKKKKRQFQDVEPVERGVIYYYSNLGKESVCRDVKVAYVNLLFGFFWCVLVCVCVRESVSVCVTSNKDNYKGVVDTHPLCINYLCVCSAKY